MYTKLIKLRHQLRILIEDCGFTKTSKVPCQHASDQYVTVNINNYPNEIQYIGASYKSMHSSMIQMCDTLRYS